MSRRALYRRAGIPEDEPLFSCPDQNPAMVSVRFDGVEFYRGPNGCLVPAHVRQWVSLDEKWLIQASGKVTPHAVATAARSVDEWMVRYTLPCPRRRGGVAYLGAEADRQGGIYRTKEKWHMYDHIYAREVIDAIDAGDPRFVVLDRAHGGVFWRGPHDCLVPFWMAGCMAEDGRNRMAADGSTSQLYVPDPPTREEWLDMYTVPLTDTWRVYRKPAPVEPVVTEAVEEEPKMMWPSEQMKFVFPPEAAQPKAACDITEWHPCPELN